MAQLIVTVPDTQVQRIRNVMGRYLQLRDISGVSRLATAEEIRLWLVSKLIEAVKEQEHRDTVNAIVTTEISVS